MNIKTHAPRLAARDANHNTIAIQHGREQIVISGVPRVPAAVRVNGELFTPCQDSVLRDVLDFELCNKKPAYDALPAMTAALMKYPGAVCTR